MPAKKITGKTALKKDYLRLPFEIYFSGPLYYTSMDLMSEKTKIKKVNDLEGIHVEKGRAYGVSFSCEKNNGSQLVCCMTGGHDEVEPEWLSVFDVEDTNMNEGYDFGLEIDPDGIILNAEPCDDFDYLEATGESLDFYEMEDQTPDYIILDADGDRIKIDCEGYLISDEDEDDHLVRREKIIDLDALDNDPSLQDFETMGFKKLQANWIKSLWGKYFPKANCPVLKKHIHI